jgi:D-beta-D-heptose 7-phosphate kinase/D-beta-D-heptose 1-phosphate adenosyltransferase
VFEENTPLELIKKLQPNIIVKGGDYTENTVVGREFAQSVKIFKTIANCSTSLTINRRGAA